MNQKISVCMATYNGEKYIREQLDSILKQMFEDDELVIIDDCSKDSTTDIIRTYNDSRIKLFVNPRNLRHVRTFEKAISLAENEIIFLADQDDIWCDGRVQIFKNALAQNPKTELVTSNFYCIDKTGNKIENRLSKVEAVDSKNNIKNLTNIFLGKIGYFGCAMAFKKSLTKVVLPIPDYVEAHDLWIAIAANTAQKNLHIDDKTLLHRMHGNNASDLQRPLLEKIYARFLLMRQLTTLILRRIT